MSIIIIISALILAIISFFFFKFFILTKLRMRYYTNLGLAEYSYSPLYGIAKEWMDYSTKDNLMPLKTLSQKDKFANKDGIVSNLLDQALVIFTNPNLVNEVLQKQSEYHKFQEPNYGLKQFIGNGLIFLEGEEWKKQRKFLSNMFKFDMIVNFLGNIRQISKDMLEKQETTQFNTNIVFSDINGAISLALFMGANMDDYKIDGQYPSVVIDKFIPEIILHYQQPFPVILGQGIVKKNLRESDRQINQKCVFIREFMRNIIKDSIKREKQLKQQNETLNHTNIITLLLKEGHQLEDKEEIELLVDISLNLYIGAKDTTTQLSSMLIYYLISNPEYYKRIQQEIQTLPNDYTFSDLQKLDLLTACIKETLRINSAAPFLSPRKAISDHFIGKYKVKKGTYVNVGFITNQLSSQYFENPFSFDPDRWFKESTINTLKQNPFVYIPFSGGMRNCIGQHLAQLQSKVVVIEFIRKYEQPSLPKDYEFEMVLKQIYALKNPLILDLVKKSK